MKETNTPEKNKKGFSDIFRKKTIERTVSETKESGRNLKRSISALELALMGVAVAVGAGIFSVGGQVVAFHAGPAAVVSFLIAGVVCALAVMCYAEFAAMAPAAGSAYSYTYMTMGEIFAWIIGWDLILEMLFSSAVIAKYWGVYLNDFCSLMGMHINSTIVLCGIKIDLASFFIVAFFTLLLMWGTNISSKFDSILTVVKIGVVLFIIVAGFMYFNPDNFSPFIPEARPAAEVTGESSVMMQPLWQWLSGSAPTAYGVPGIISGAALVFFAFIGFDVVATVSEEVKDPSKNVPRGIIFGISAVVVIYMLIAFVTAGMVPYDKLAQAGNTSLTTSFSLVGADWAAKIISFGILIGLTTVVMVLLLGFARIIFAISRDGLLPRSFSKTGRHGTPAMLQLGCGIIVFLILNSFDITVLSDMINIGTLSSFVLVAIDIPIMRRRRPDAKRTIKVPGNPWLPIIIALSCFGLMINLSVMTWIRFLIWMALGFIVYFGYSNKHALLNKKAGKAEENERLEAQNGKTETLASE